MFSLRNWRLRKSGACTWRARAGFTLSEAVIALAVLGTMSGGAYIGFNAINAYSASSRLFSEAQAVAQHQIDIILSKGPFNITSTPHRVPLELMTDAELTALSPALSTTPPATTNKYFPYYRPTGTTGLTKEAFIYTDPTTGQVLVRGVLNSKITPIDLSMTYAGVTSSLNLRRATVDVKYDWRNKPYTVVMETIRTADQ
jgi:prepilin-type N-terminal cleavage/methylation domain-containing protein